VADSNNDSAAVWRLVSADANAAAVVSVCIVLLHRDRRDEGEM
jgi:anti-sigma-K factor RskA